MNAILKAILFLGAATHAFAFVIQRPIAATISTTNSNSIHSISSSQPQDCRRGSVAGGVRPLEMALVQACTTVNDIVYSKLVVVFGVSDDAQTLRIEDLLTTGHVQFTSVYLDQVPNGPEMMEAITHMTGRDQVPCIYIDGKFVGGQDHIMAMNLDGYLGRLLKEVGAIPYDRMRELKKEWRRPASLNLNGSRRDRAELT